MPPLSHTGKTVGRNDGSVSGDRGGRRSTGYGGSGGQHVVSDLSPSSTKLGCAEEKVGGCGEERRQLPVAANFDLLTISREEGTGEWNYPWDLTGGLYR